MTQPENRNTDAAIWRYGAVGAAFGLCFPLASMLFLVGSGAVPASGSASALVAATHLHCPLLYVVDTAPLFLGLFAAFAGIRQAKLVLLNASLGEQVAQKTASLREALERSEKANLLISHMADHDALTGLLNRRRLHRDIVAAVAHARRYGHPFALVFADLDRFKQVNDTYGHEAGDRYLTGFAALLERLIRDTDSLARWGGDEFVVLLPETDRTGAERFVERVRGNLTAQTVEIGPAHVAPVVSFGVAVFPDDGGDAESLLALADGAMYRDKLSRRSDIAVRP